MKAIILAAGLGTRLLPLTKDRPKALIQVQGKPLLQHQLEKLKAAGFSKVLINIHHFGDQIVDFLEMHNSFEMDIEISDERNALLDTGGALRKAAHFIQGEEPVLIHNVDVLSTIALEDMFNNHKLRAACATLAVRHRPSTRYLLFDERNQLRAWENLKTGEKKGDWSSMQLIEAAFSGIHIISPQCVDLFPDKQAFSIIDFYISLIDSHTVSGYFHDNSVWLDVGKPETLTEAEKLKL
ncbi:MAG: nucleotidyltransferase family protein [Bacteroidales bacterium]|nr:nucleotidyltransferase family protein [Bacteroidales bacterium]